MKIQFLLLILSCLYSNCLVSKEITPNPIAASFHFNPPLGQEFIQNVNHRLIREVQFEDSIEDLRRTSYSLSYQKPTSDSILLQVIPTGYDWTRNLRPMRSPTLETFLNKPIRFHLENSGILKSVTAKNASTELLVNFENSYKKRFLPLDGLRLSQTDVLILEDSYQLDKENSLEYCALLIPMNPTPCSLGNCLEFKLYLSNLSTNIKQQIMSLKRRTHGNLDQRRLMKSKRSGLSLSGTGRILMNPNTMMTASMELSTKITWKVVTSANSSRTSSQPKEISKHLVLHDQYISTLHKIIQEP